MLRDSDPGTGAPAVAAGRRKSVWLPAIVLAYLGLATAYALATPRWQVPDEPAHYNYVAELARLGQLPVLEPGEYPHEYLERIKAARFPAEMPVDSIRYESWQPPLYYALAAVIFKGTSTLPGSQQFLALRLLSVVLGAILLLVANRIVGGVFPGDDVLALSTVAFVAFLPMHLTMTAAVNNDASAELVLALIVWLALRRLAGQISERRYILLGGVLLGLALLTKTTIYLPSAVVLIAGATGHWLLGERSDRKVPLFSVGSILVLALAISSWWFVRNALIYGEWDFLAWGRHAQIVTGQPRTSEWVAQFGALRVVQEFLVTSFKSFWGVFGWMGVPMPARFYQVLALACAAAVFGLGVWLLRLARGGVVLSRYQRAALGLLALPPVLALAMHVGYNLSFVQHQGRYLFPGLISAALFFNLGLRELTGRRLAPLVLGCGYFGLFGLAVYSLVRFIIPNL